MPKRLRTAKPHPVSKFRTKARLVSKAHIQERDENQIAFDAVQKLLELTEGTEGKNPLAVALGRLGGLKGGKARAEKLTPEQRRKSAMKAAKARWEKGKG